MSNSKKNKKVTYNEGFKIMQKYKIESGMVIYLYNLSTQETVQDFKSSLRYKVNSRSF